MAGWLPGVRYGACKRADADQQWFPLKFPLKVCCAMFHVVLSCVLLTDFLWMS
jgi:hypothetical protein